MNQELNLKTHIPSKTSSKVSCHQTAKTNSVAIWEFLDGDAIVVTKWRC
jgi:hypothetical protein